MNASDDLSGKIFLITGATSGIGLAAAQTLAQHGAGVIGIGRNPARCREAEQQIRAAVPDARVGFCLADFSRLADVRAVLPQVRQTLAGWGAAGLDGLVNNAGVVSPTYVRTEDGLELTAAVTHFAHFLLTNLLLPELKAAPQGRVVTVTSNNHRLAWLNLTWLVRPPLYFILWAYANAKLCNVLFTYEFNRRYAETRMRAFALDPGLVDTGIGQKSSSGLVDWVWGLRRRGGASPQIPADGILHLVANPDLQQASQYYWLRTRQSKAPSRFALDERAAAELWAISEQACGVKLTP